MKKILLLLSLIPCYAVNASLGQVIRMATSPAKTLKGRDQAKRKWFAFGVDTKPDVIETFVENSKQFYLDADTLLNLKNDEGDTLLLALGRKGLEEGSPLYNKLENLGTDVTETDADGKRFSFIAGQYIVAQKEAVLVQWFAFDAHASQTVLENFVTGNQHQFDDAAALVNAKNHDNKSRTLLHVFADNGITEEDDLWKCLVFHGVNPLLADVNGATAVELALNYKKTKALEAWNVFLADGAEIDIEKFIAELDKVLVATGKAVSADFYDKARAIRVGANEGDWDALYNEAVTVVSGAPAPGGAVKAIAFERVRVIPPAPNPAPQPQPNQEIDADQKITKGGSWSPFKKFLVVAVPVFAYFAYKYATRDVEQKRLQAAALK